MNNIRQTILWNGIGALEGSSVRKTVLSAQRQPINMFSNSALENETGPVLSHIRGMYPQNING